MKRVDIAVFGAAALHILWEAKTWPNKGEYLPGTSSKMDIGGRAANQSVAAAKTGANVALITRLGDDELGKEYLEHLRKNNIKTDFVTMCDNASTAVYQKTITEDGVIETFFDGAINLINANDIENAKSVFCDAKVLICQQEISMDVTLLALRKFKGISILNASPNVSVDTTELMKAASIVCLTGIEAAQLVGVGSINTPKDCIAALDVIIGRGAQAAIIILGPIGCVYALNTKPIRCIHVPIIGALDMNFHTFTDYFIGALAFFMANFPDTELHQKIGGANEIAVRLMEHIAFEKKDIPQMQVLRKKFNLNINLNKQCYQWETLTKND